MPQMTKTGVAAPRLAEWTVGVVVSRQMQYYVNCAYLCHAEMEFVPAVYVNTFFDYLNVFLASAVLMGK